MSVSHNNISKAPKNFRGFTYVIIPGHCRLSVTSHFNQQTSSFFVIYVSAIKTDLAEWKKFSRNMITGSRFAGFLAVNITFLCYLYRRYSILLCGIKDIWIPVDNIIPSSACRIQKRDHRAGVCLVLLCFIAIQIRCTSVA